MVKKMTANNKRPLFHPTFGSRPTQIVGRDGIIESFIESLGEPIGSRDRCTLMIGQRGMGKTALLQELAEIAEEEGYVTASVTCYEKMNEEIVEILQRKGNEIAGKSKRKLQGAQAGAFGFSFGFSFSEEADKQLGFRSKLTMLVDKLCEYVKGVVIFVDEAKGSEGMRQLAVTYQQLVGEEKNISICMAGLPAAISSVLNDDVLTFLNRARRIQIGPISISAIADYYREAFDHSGVGAGEKIVLKAADATKGFPYLMQLIGYYMVKFAGGKYKEEKLLDRATESAQKDLEENVYAPLLRPLSDKDRDFLNAMSEDEGSSKVADICARLGKGNSEIQPYRKRLMDAEIITSDRRGEVSFTIPYLNEYLRKKPYI